MVSKNFVLAHSLRHCVSSPDDLGGTFIVGLGSGGFCALVLWNVVFGGGDTDQIF